MANNVCEHPHIIITLPNIHGWYAVSVHNRYIYRDDHISTEQCQCYQANAKQYRPTKFPSGQSICCNMPQQCLLILVFRACSKFIVYNYTVDQSSTHWLHVGWCTFLVCITPREPRSMHIACLALVRSFCYGYSEIN